MNRLRGLRWALPAAAIVAVIDQITKRWALGRLTPGRCEIPDSCIDLIWGARFHLVFNTGAAFARGQGLGPLLGILVSIITVVLLVVAWGRSDRIGAVLLGLIAGGAVGNLIDRLYRADDGFLSGAVVDFIDLGWWPVFNVADAAVVCGVIGFILLSWAEGDVEDRESIDAPRDEGPPDDETNITDDGDDVEVEPRADDGEPDVSLDGNGTSAVSQP